MITSSEERFMEYWKNNREREKKLFRQLVFGLPVGMLLGIGVFISLITDKWYERADMIANSQVNPNVLIVAILAIGIFTGLFYKKFRWDQNEQQYKELLAKKRRNDKAKEAEQ